MTLVVRESHAVPPHPDLVLVAGDVVFALGVEDEALLADAFAGHACALARARGTDFR